MARDEKGFAAFVEPMVMDGYLDTGEEVAAMARASEFGLTGPDAEKLLVKMCQERGAVLERLAKLEFKAHVTAAVGDKYLDAGELKELEQSGLKQFADAENPSELVDRLISEVLRLEGAYTESSLRQEIMDQLKPHQAQGVRIRAEDWQRIRSGALERLRAAGVDLEENDEIGENMDQWLKASGLQIGGGGKGPITLGLAALFGLILIGSAVAVLVMGSGGGESATPEGPKVPSPSGSLPPCDTACAEQLQTHFQSVDAAAKNLRYATPADDCVKKWYGLLREGCAPFNALTPPRQREALAASAGWGWCDQTEVTSVLQKVVGDYLRWADGAKGGGGNVSSCEWLSRCLDVVPENEPCTAAKPDYGCR